MSVPGLPPQRPFPFVKTRILYGLGLTKWYTIFFTRNRALRVLPGRGRDGTIKVSYNKRQGGPGMKLWHGIVLGVIFFFLGYQIAGALGIPLDARSLAFSGLLTLLVAAVLLMRLPAAQRTPFRCACGVYPVHVGIDQRDLFNFFQTDHGVHLTGSRRSGRLRRGVPPPRHGPGVPGKSPCSPWVPA